MTRALEVLEVGAQVLVEDLGRPGLASVGVGRSGAADRGAHRLGARLLAQSPALASLEVLLGGLRVRARGQVTIALTGAAAPARVDGRRVGHRAPVVLVDGAELNLGVPAVGLRTYLAVRGGLDLPSVLGSRSRDTLAGLGPRPLRAGDVVPIGPAPPDHPGVDHAPARPTPAADLLLPVLPGPRTTWLEDPAALAETGWTVSERSDRVGSRLGGTPLARASAYRERELPSEPMVRGAVQVPPDGQPVIFGADHPVTGGYPVVGVVPSEAVDRLAQAAPGTRVHLRWSRTSREGASVP